MAPLVPYLRYREIRARAREFLATHNPSGQVPVPVDLIAEERLGIEIVPMPGVLHSRGINGYLTSDRSSIYVDESLFKRAESRYLFTIAHELGHHCMHADLYTGFASDDEWFRFRRNLSAESLEFAEFQANSFAGLILVPDAQLGDQVKSVYNRLAARVREQYGGEFDFASEAFWDHVARALCRTFKVSHITARIRLQNDGYWCTQPE